MSAARSRRANDKHNHLQRTPILVMGCSLLIACCIAFGGTNWTASAQPSEDQLPEQNAIVEPGYYQETIGSYEAISQSDDDERADDTFALPKGTEITREIALDAKKHDALLLLTMSVD